MRTNSATSATKRLRVVKGAPIRSAVKPEADAEAADGALSNIVVQKASEVLAARLRQMILSGEYGPGATLPNERELVARSGLGRSSVREALKFLAAEGLIATRSGRGGGSIVTLPSRESISKPVELFIRSHEISFETLLDCRVTIEPALARLAALNRTDKEAAALQELHDEFARNVDHVENYRRLNLEWHLAIARASKNQPLMAFMEAISSPILASSKPRHSTTPQIRRQTVKVHGRIQAAIMARDGDAAFRAMSDHVCAFQRLANDQAAAQSAKAK